MEKRILRLLVVVLVSLILLSFWFGLQRVRLSRVGSSSETSPPADVNLEESAVVLLENNFNLDGHALSEVSVRDGYSRFDLSVRAAGREQIFEVIIGDLTRRKVFLYGQPKDRLVGSEEVSNLVKPKRRVIVYFDFSLSKNAAEGCPDCAQLAEEIALFAEPSREILKNFRERKVLETKGKVVVGPVSVLEAF